MKRWFHQLIVLSLVCFLLSCKAGSDNNFAQFRGTNSLGIAAQNANPPIEISPDKNLQWETGLASGVSSPCVVNNRIFATGFNEADSSLITYCINSSNGEVEWQQNVHPDTLESIHQVGSQAAATPASDGKYVYVYFGSYGMVCFNLSGTLIWERKLPLKNIQYGSGASPIIAGDKLILNMLGNNNPTVLAFNKINGETIWETSLNIPPGLNQKMERSHATPVIWKNQIIIHRLMGLTAIAVEDGRELWNIGIPSVGPGTPIIIDNYLYLNAYMNYGESRLHDELPEFSELLEMYDSNGDKEIQFTEIPKELALFRRPELDLPLGNDVMYSWRNFAPNFDISQNKGMNQDEWDQMQEYLSDYIMEHGVIAFKLSESDEPELLWKVKDYVSEVPSLMYENNRVYMITNGGYVTCMDSESGEIIYREKLGAPGAYIASPLIANHHIYFTSYNGRLTVIEPGDELKITAVSDLHEKIAASPVAVGDKLFIRSVNSLEAFVN